LDSLNNKPLGCYYGFSDIFLIKAIRQSVGQAHKGSRLFKGRPITLPQNYPEACSELIRLL
jgi:hypothetical protein